MTMVKPVHASGTVASTAPMWCANEYDPASCIYPTKEDACRAAIGNRSDYYYGFVYYFPGGEMVGYACYGYATSQPGNGYWAQRFGWLTTKASCPLNSQPTGTTTCTCTDPYMPDPTATSCVPANNCPANMSGSPCACNAGFVLNPYGAGCIQEQYTISVLQDPNPDVEPGLSRDVVVRVISAQTNNPKSGARVSLKADVEITSGGHAHGESVAPRDKGALIGDSACEPTEKNCAAATTDPNGYASFAFKAPAASGKHTVTAACISPACTNTDTGKINVKVPNLITIPATSLLYTFIGAVEGKHTDNHYLTGEAVDILWGMAASYHLDPAFKQNGVAPPPLGLNDASLVWGGLFDKNANWGTPHAKHRSGVVIDVRANMATGAIPEASFTNFEDMAAKAGGDAQLHCSSTRDPAADNCVGDDNRHYHILLLGRDQ